MPRKKATTIDGLTKVEGVWPEVHTGIEKPKVVIAGERVEIDAQVAAGLIKSGSCKRVG